MYISLSCPTVESLQYRRILSRTIPRIMICNYIDEHLVTSTRVSNSQRVNWLPFYSGIEMTATDQDEGHGKRTHGYPVECLRGHLCQHILEDLICSLCRGILRSAVQVSCGARFCEECYKALFRWEMCKITVKPIPKLWHNMSIVFQISGSMAVCSAAYSDEKHRNTQGSRYWRFVRAIHCSPVDSPHKGPVMRKACPCHDVIKHNISHIIYSVCFNFVSLWLF